MNDTVLRKTLSPVSKKERHWVGFEVISYGFAVSMPLLNKFSDRIPREGISSLFLFIMKCCSYVRNKNMLGILSLFLYAFHCFYLYIKCNSLFIIQTK